MMDYLTNPFVVSFIASLIGFAITYFYLKKTSEHPEKEIDKMTCVKNGVLIFVITLLTTGYLTYVHSEKESSALATEFFQTGQPQF